MNRIRLLLLSGGSQVGQNILDVLADRRNQVELIATNSAADDPPLFACDRVYLVPPTASDPQGFEQRILEILAQEQPDLVIPCRDDDTVFLAGFRERHPHLAGSLLCGSLTCAEAMCDKYLSWEFSTQTGLPFAPTLGTPNLMAAEAFAAHHGFPLLVKPRRGHAGRGVYFVFNQAQLAQAAAAEGLVIQRYLGDPALPWQQLNESNQRGLPLFHSLEGLKHSIQIFIAPDGSPAGNFSSVNVNRIGSSVRLTRYQGEDTRQLGEKCLAVFAAAGWRGPINIQCQQTPDGELMIYEYNARISGATAARLHMGHDELALVFRHFLGRELPQTTLPPGPRIVRHPVDRALPEADIAHLQAKGVWEAQSVAKAVSVCAEPPLTGTGAPLSLALNEDARPALTTPYLIGLLPGEGIGPEVTQAALQVLETLEALSDKRFVVRQGGLIGTAAERTGGKSLSDEVTDFSTNIFAAGGALLCGPGGARFVYELRAHFDLFCKFTPLKPFAALQDTGPLRPDRMTGVDIVAVRENTGGLYFGEWGRHQDPEGERAYHHLSYHTGQVDRILGVALRLAAQRQGRLCIALKPYGIPAISQLWQERAQSLNQTMHQNPVTISVLEIDNAAYQLIANGPNFDVIASPNMFGDVLADVGALLLGSRGMSFSGNFGPGRAVYQTGHGAAYDLAGHDTANPLGQILSLGMMLRESFAWPAGAARLEAAIANTLTRYRTADLASPTTRVLGTQAMAGQICRSLQAAGPI